MRANLGMGVGGLALVAGLLVGCNAGKTTLPPAPAEGGTVPTVERPIPSVAPPTPTTVEPLPGLPEMKVATPSSNEGPWPTDPVRDYSRDFNVGQPKSVGLDAALNLWLLDGDRIGVLAPGKTEPTWARGVGQARMGFGREALATGSTVICGGEAGRAYVGYSTYGLQSTVPGKPHAYIPPPGETYYTPERFAEYQKGDLDAVRLLPDGSIALEEHIWRTTGLSNKDRVIGIHNTNDFRYDEDRSVLACQRVTRGTNRGDVFITTDHGVTRIQGLVYNSHRHPGWYKYVPLENGTLDAQLQTTEMYGLGIAPSGDVLVANEQMMGVLKPSAKLEEWDREQTWEGPTPWTFRGFNEQLNGQEEYDFWRAFEQTTSGRYWLGSESYGVWNVEPKGRSAGTWTKLAGLPTDRIAALKSTDDGALYIGTDGEGLWRLGSDGVSLARVGTVAGNHVRQLVYEPSVTPSMLLVLTEDGLTVLRGP